MDGDLTELSRRVEEIETLLSRAPTRGDATLLRLAIREVDERLQEIDQGVEELRTKLGSLAARAQSLPASEAMTPERPEPPPPLFVWSDLASSTYIQKGWNSIAAGDYESALGYLERAVQAAPEDAAALSALGWAQSLSQEYEQALQTFQQVLALDPDNALARVHLGYICLKKRIYGEAIEHLSRVVRSSGDRKAALYGNYYLGLVYLSRDMHTDAIGFFEKAIEMGPAMAEAYFQLGRAHYLAGRVQRAVTVWKQGTSANRYDPWAKRCAESAQTVEAGGPPRFE